MIYLRYHEREWTYNDHRRELTTKDGVIPLCTERKPRKGARPITRIGENEWSIAACVYRNGCFMRVLDSDFIMLLGTPESLSTAFQHLFT